MLPMKDELVTARLTLRLFRDADLEDMKLLLGSAEIKKTYMLPDLEDDAAAAEMFARYRRMAPGRLCYAVCLGDSVIGFIHEVRHEGPAIEVGYALRPDCWNRGFMTEALGAVISEAFRMGFDTVTAGYFEGNAASRRVMEKNGMRPVSKEDFIPYRGEMRRCLYLERTVQSET